MIIYLCRYEHAIIRNILAPYTPVNVGPLKLSFLSRRTPHCFLSRCYSFHPSCGIPPELRSLLVSVRIGCNGKRGQLVATSGWTFCANNKWTSILFSTAASGTKSDARRVSSRSVSLHEKSRNQWSRTTPELLHLKKSLSSRNAKRLPWPSLMRVAKFRNANLVAGRENWRGCPMCHWIYYTRRVTVALTFVVNKSNI